MGEPCDTGPQAESEMKPKHKGIVCRLSPREIIGLLQYMLLG